MDGIGRRQYREDQPSNDVGILPGIRQHDLFAGSGRRRALALLHGHQVADVGQHGFQVGHREITGDWSGRTNERPGLRTLGVKKKRRLPNDQSRFAYGGEGNGDVSETTKEINNNKNNNDCDHTQPRPRLSAA